MVIVISVFLSMIQLNTSMCLTTPIEYQNGRVLIPILAFWIVVFPIHTSPDQIVNYHIWIKVLHRGMYSVRNQVCINCRKELNVLAYLNQFFFNFYFIFHCTSNRLQFERIADTPLCVLITRLPIMITFPCSFLDWNYNMTFTKTKYASAKTSLLKQQGFVIFKIFTLFACSVAYIHHFDIYFVCFSSVVHFLNRLFCWLLE